MSAGSMACKAGSTMPAAVRRRSRPNDMKVAPIMAVVDAPMVPGVPIAFEQLRVHTRQHDDRVLSGLFFEERGQSCPDMNLEGPP